MLAVCLRLLIRLWLATLRLRRTGPAFARPSIVAFWHGDQLPLIAVRPNRPVVAPVSLSRDGELQAHILAGLGIDAVRGSSSRGGSRAALGLVRALRRGHVVLVAVDGPRGPGRAAKPGVAFLSSAAPAPVYPVGVAVSAGWRLRRSWDRYLLPCPFARVQVVVAEPVTREEGEPYDRFCARLGLEIEACRGRARALLRRPDERPGRESGDA